jgi:hypothetical protein
MLILRAELTSLRSEPRSELGLGELTLLPVARSAGRENVRDPVGASALQRDPVVDLERRDEQAVSAPAAVKLNEGTPFGIREVSLRLAGASPVPVALCSQHLGVRLVVRGHHRLVLFAVPRVVKALGRASLFGMGFAPASNRIARLLRIAL